MRAFVPVGIVVAFLVTVAGMVNAAPPLAQAGTRTAISIPPLSRMPFLLRPDSSKSAAYAVLYAFGNQLTNPPDSYQPNGLIYENGAFYSTACGGGAYGHGTFFKMTPRGTESILFSFNGIDGSCPFNGAGALIYANCAFYGTTYSGGKKGYGTVFEVTPGGTEKVLHSFSGADGQYPLGSLVYANGVLYGTTSEGGKYGGGTVFEVNAGGTETVLHSFGNGTDGYEPIAGLVYVNGLLYGTTYYGGANDLGTVFKITTSGAEWVLHSFFAVQTDGLGPGSDLVYANGVLYGMTTYGGKGQCQCGTVFAITTTGQERVVHSFKPADGIAPLGGLVYANGVFYGTTDYDSTYDYGTVFEMSPSGTLSVLHSFNPRNGTDGAFPYGDLVYVNGSLYGTTQQGGPYNNGGIFFGLTP